MRAAALGLALLLTAGAAWTEERPLFEAVQRADTLNYLLHLPAGYEETDAAFPLLFFLHGIVQKGTDSEAFLGNVADHGPFRTMRDGAWDETLPLIVVAPQSTGLQPWWRGEAVRAVLEHVLDTYRIDHSRRYLSGISMGGRGVWWLAKNFSNEFAAVVPVSGWAGDLSRSCDVFKPLGVWAFHGRRDPIIRYPTGRKPIDTLLDCPEPGRPLPKLTTFDDVGHGQWTRVYASDHGSRNQGADGRDYEDIYRWMLTFSR